jgi:hypothetical protein
MLQKLLSARSPIAQIELGQKGVSASNAKTAVLYNLLLYGFRMTCLSANILIPSNDEKRRLMFETVPPRCFPLRRGTTQVLKPRYPSVSTLLPSH